MGDVVKLSNDELREIGVNKLKHRKLITQETQKMRKGSPRSALSAHQIEKELEDISRGKPKKLVLISTGGAAQQAGEVLGEFQYLADNKYYVQTSTEQSNEKFQARYMFQDSGNRWWVGDTPGKKAGVLQNRRTNIEGLPENGSWLYWDLSKKSWQDDKTLTVSSGPLPTLPRLFTVTATGAAADKFPDYLGIFTQTQRWWEGKPVYTNTQGCFLHQGGIDFGWMIGRALGRYVLRGSRARDSPSTEDSWRYWTESGDKPASVTVTGSD